MSIIRIYIDISFNLTTEEITMITIDNNYQQQYETMLEEEFHYYENIGKTESYTVEITDGVFLITEYKEGWI